VISVVSQHLTGKDGTDTVPELRDITLDVGAKKKDGGKAVIKPGDGIVYDYPFTDFGDGFYRGKAVDARLGAAILLRLIEEITPTYDTWFVFTASSKLEHRGATVAARRIDPGTVVVVEAAAAGDIPLQKEELRSVRVGGGAVLGLKEYGAVYTREFREHFEKLAVKNGIRTQIRSGMMGCSDAGALHIMASGARVAGIGAPVRYVGTGNPIVHKDDLEAAWQLMKCYVEGE
jgi:endoglucanase